MRILRIALFSVILTLIAGQSFASDQKLVFGAGTIPSRDVAVSLDLGIQLPEPLLYGVRADFGIGDRVQLGIGGTYWGIFAGGGLYSTFNILRNKSKRDFLSLYFNPGFIYARSLLFSEDPNDSHVFLFYLRPGAAYEHRFGEERRTAVYGKLGAALGLGSSANGKIKWASFSTDSTAITITPGFQHNFGGMFSLAAEADIFISPICTTYANGSTSSRIGGGFKIALSWVF